MGRFYGETPGADFLETRAGKCKKCKAPFLVGLLRNAKGTLRWQNFNAKPNERGGLRYYTRHICATTGAGETGGYRGG